MSKVYGASDDIVVIQDSDGTHHEIDYHNDVDAVVIGFEDDTVIRVGYGKGNKGIWWIEIVTTGSATCKMTECNDEDAEVYSDVFEIRSEVVGWGYDYK